MYKTKQCTNTSVSTCSGGVKWSPFLHLPHVWHNTHQFADLFLPVWGWSGSGSNHSGSLIVSEFLYASLSCHYVAHLKFPHRKKIKHSPTGFFFSLQLFFHWCSTEFLKIWLLRKEFANIWTLFPSDSLPQSQNTEFWVYLPPEEGMCVSAPVQLVNMEGEGSVKLIYACP